MVVNFKVENEHDRQPLEIKLIPDIGAHKAWMELFFKHVREQMALGNRIQCEAGVGHRDGEEIYYLEFKPIPNNPDPNADKT